jgi:hypothetical protein
MFRVIRTFLPSLLLLLLVGACSDLPTSTFPPAADLDHSGLVQENSIECGGDSNPCLLPPAGNDPGDPVCDPYLTLSGCGGECTEGTPGSPETVGVEGCGWTGGGGGGGGGGGDPSGGGGGGGETPPGVCPTWDPDCAAGSYDQGPLLWAACILTLTGSLVSVNDVAGAFQTWHEASGRLSVAERELLMVQENYPHAVDHATLLWAQSQRDQAQLWYNAAKSAVSSSANVSYLALGMAAVTCGASLFLPTP